MNFNGICMVHSSCLAPYTLRRNEHVRIDVIVQRFSKTHKSGSMSSVSFFLLPMTLLILYLSVPFAFESIRNQKKCQTMLAASSCGQPN